MIEIPAPRPPQLLAQATGELAGAVTTLNASISL
jgi:hypothetical protein